MPCSCINQEHEQGEMPCMRGGTSFCSCRSWVVLTWPQRGNRPVLRCLHRTCKMQALHAIYRYAVAAEVFCRINTVALVQYAAAVINST